MGLQTKRKGPKRTATIAAAMAGAQDDESEDYFDPKPTIDVHETPRDISLVNAENQFEIIA
jgi:hypothetical protein